MIRCLSVCLYLYIYYCVMSCSRWTGKQLLLYELDIRFIPEYAFYNFCLDSKILVLTKEFFFIASRCILTVFISGVNRRKLSVKTFCFPTSTEFSRLHIEWQNSMPHLVVRNENKTLNIWFLRVGIEPKNDTFIVTRLFYCATTALLRRRFCYIMFLCFELTSNSIHLVYCVSLCLMNIIINVLNFNCKM